MVNKLNRPDGNGKLVFISSLFPITDPTSGAPVIHRNQALALHEAGYDVVLLEGSNRLNDLAPHVPYKIRSLFFDGRENNPEYEKEPHRYDAVGSFASVPFNIPVFESAPSSSNRVINLTDAQLGQYIMSWAWRIRSAMLVYGVPDAAWNGHAWILNAITAGVPTAFTVHGTDIKPKPGEIGIGGYSETRLHRLNQYGIDRAFLASAISDQEFDNITDPKRYGMDPKKVRVIYNGYDTDIFRLGIEVTKAELMEKHGDKLKGVDPSAPWVVFAGRAANFKGIDNLLRAMQTVIAESRAHLIIMGAGEYGKVPLEGDSFMNLYELTERLGLNGRVHFIGALKQSQMAEMISVSESYPLPSRKEPFGNVAIEGMGVGRTPILTASGGFLNIVGNRTDVARMVKAENPDSLEVLELAQRHVELNSDKPLDMRLEMLDMLFAQIKGGRVKPRDFSESSIAELNRVKTSCAQNLAVSSLADGILADLALTSEERRRRGLVSEAYSRENFNMRKIAKEEMVPWIERAITEGSRANFSLTYTPDPHGPLRKERLGKILLNSDVASAYTYLRNTIGTEEFGAAWRAFDNSVALYFGHAELLHPYDPAALPDFAESPNAIFSEVARAAGVSTQTMFETMRQVELTPVAQLEYMPVPMTTGAAITSGLTL